MRHVLGSIRVPTLVLHRTHNSRIQFEAGRYLADNIHDARFVELPGRDHVIWSGDVDRVVDEIEEFLTGMRPVSEHDRVLATLVVARLAAPQHLAAALGDRSWSDRLSRLRQAAQDVMAHYGGVALDLGLEQISARFDGPVRAVRCALALRDVAGTLGFALSAGVHTGEIELGERMIAGLAIYITHLVSAKAKAGEVLASGIVVDLVAGSGLQFAKRGSETMEGLDAPLRLLAVLDEHPRGASPRPASAATLQTLARASVRCWLWSPTG